ncbi:MAG TPA: hypothetical protein VGE02_01590 [Gemmatimonadales bacterium]
MSRAVAAAAAVVTMTTAVALTASRAQAQPTGPREPTVTLDCRPASVLSLTDAEIGDAWMPYHPGRMLARLRPLADAGDWRTMMDSVSLRGREALLLAPDSLLGRYRAELARTVLLFDRLLDLPPERQSRFMADSVRPTRWQLNQSPVTGDVPVFQGADAIVVTAAMESSERRALCWPAIAMNGLLTMYRAPARDATVEALHALAGRWDSYIEHSYSQLPWELLVNGLGRSPRSWEPPTAQWVLLHPSVGVEVAGLSRDELVRVDVAVLEVGGYLRYFRDYTRRVGVSGVATFATDRPMAVGAYLHLWYPQARIGYLVRPRVEGRDRGSVLVSIDLYGLLTDAPAQLKQAREAALRMLREELAAGERR